MHDAPGDQFQIDAGVFIVWRCQAKGVVEPRRALAQLFDGIFRRGVLGDSLGEREAQIEGGAVAQYRVWPGFVAGRQKGVRGGVGVARIELFDPQVVAPARGQRFVLVGLVRYGRDINDGIFLRLCRGFRCRRTLDRRRHQERHACQPRVPHAESRQRDPPAQTAASRLASAPSTSQT